ncbi:ABC transporter permease [Microbacterium oxydans]|uniref:ABC transporter permease n=1 Tax=Microbacterium TaxID=33882 RepID=UPI00187D5756|nr:ABC transporter permease [Microbacterium sp. R1]MBE7956389.1 ABC transporter permease [Microbacterium sp. R1]MCB8044054.1 ABC transporter permease [Microbacterium oxydans]
MIAVLALVRRNLRLFFRDRLNVFFSLLAAVILFGLYALFLGNLQTADLEKSFPQASPAQIKAFVDSWMYAGIVSMTAITTGLAAFGVLVEDAATGRFRDLLVSPLRRGQLVLGYFLAALIVALLMTGILLAFGLLSLFFVNGVIAAPASLLRVIGYIVLVSCAFAALSAFVVSFVATPGAFAALSTIVGTILGFLAGAYIPVGSLPEAVRATVNALPFAQSSMLLRQEFTASTLGAVAGEQDAIAGLRDYFGVDIAIGELQITAAHVLVLLSAMTVVFATLAAARIRSRMGHG